MLQVPPAQQAIAAATDQHPSSRTPYQRVHDRARLAQGLQALPTAAPLDVPEPDCLVQAATGHEPPIGTPDHGEHGVGVPCERLAHTLAFYAPQLDGAIPTRAG